MSFTVPFLTSTLSALYHGNRGVVRTPPELLTSVFELGTLNHSAITDVLADSPDTSVQVRHVCVYEARAARLDRQAGHRWWNLHRLWNISQSDSVIHVCSY